MNHKLQLNIQEIQREHNYTQRSPSEYVEQSEGESENEGHSQQDGEQDQEGSQYNAEEIINSPSNEYESMQTFGNAHKPHTQYFDLLNKHDTINNLLSNKQSSKLPQTPIDMSDSSLNKHSNKHSANQDHSSIDEQINRIVVKVMQKDKPKMFLGQSAYQKQVQRVHKIDKINQELLNENAQLISQINQLQKKLQSVSKGANKKIKKKEQTTAFQDKDLMKTLKKYREKLSKALNIHSKLSSRLLTEKSKSQIISNTQRSMTNRAEGYTQEMGVISTIRSSSIREDKKKQEMVGKNWREGYCRKCCREIKGSNVSDVPESKRSMFSPVLQVKNYKISNSRQSSDYIIQGALLKKITSSTSCQVDIYRPEQEQQLLALEQQERQLQSLVNHNNNLIQEYENRLFKMMELQ